MRKSAAMTLTVLMLCLVLLPSCVNSGAIALLNSSANCSCGCSECGCAKPETLFTFRREKMMKDWISISYSHDSLRSHLVFNQDKEISERVLELINSFVPESSEEQPEAIGCGGWHVRIYLFDDYKNFTISDAQTITFDGTIYHGSEGCLQELIDIFEELPKIDYSHYDYVYP